MSQFGNSGVFTGGAAAGPPPAGTDLFIGRTLVVSELGFAPPTGQYENWTYHFNSLNDAIDAIQKDADVIIVFPNSSAGVWDLDNNLPGGGAITTLNLHLMPGTIINLNTTLSNASVILIDGMGTIFQNVDFTVQGNLSVQCEYWLADSGGPFNLSLGNGTLTNINCINSFRIGNLITLSTASDFRVTAGTLVSYTSLIADNPSGTFYFIGNNISGSNFLDDQDLNDWKLYFNGRIEHSTEAAWLGITNGDATNKVFLYGTLEVISNTEAISLTNATLSLKGFNIIFEVNDLLGTQPPIAKINFSTVASFLKLYDMYLRFTNGTSSEIILLENDAGNLALLSNTILVGSDVTTRCIRSDTATCDVYVIGCDSNRSVGANINEVISVVNVNANVQ